MKHFAHCARLTGRLLALSLVAAVATSPMVLPSPARASGDDPLPKPTGSPSAQPSAEEIVNQGIDLAKQGKWKEAEASYRRATKLSPGLPEAWNGLGHSLKMERRYDDALVAYHEALRQRPAYPQALEYLGETYLAMGRYKDAEKTLARLRPLDAALAAQLDSSIVNRTQRASSW